MSRVERADCIVVGAGPAGSITAMLLARAGFDILILDSKAFPRDKPCGDCISPQANLLLHEFGLWAAVMTEQPARLRGWRIASPAGHSFTARFADLTSDERVQTGLALQRSRFDATLLAAARAAGARVLTGMRVDQLLFANDGVRGVTARSADGSQLRVTAPLTIGADGLRSTVRQRLNLAARAPRLRKVALTAHATGVSDLTDLGELHLGAGECAGLAPVNDSSSACNLTLVLDADRFGRELAGKPIPRFRERLEHFPLLRGRFQRIELLASLMASGPFDRPASAVVVPGAALVGDAAGYFDPFTGQGIFQALAGAQELAGSAMRALKRGQAHRPLHEYARAYRRLARGTRLVQKAIDAVCARPACADRCIAAFARAPRAAAQLVAVTGDLRPAASLLSPLPLLSFLFGLSTWGTPP